MDQKSFSVLLSLTQSSPVDGGLISGVVRSAAKPTVANVSSTSPRTSFFIERPPSDLETLSRKNRSDSTFANAIAQRDALPCRTFVGNHVIVVGGGLAGLATALYLARAGRIVTLFEKRRNLGGRAVTHLRHGFRFNLGPHTVYRKGAGRTVYRELGISIRG